MAFRMNHNAFFSRQSHLDRLTRMVSEKGRMMLYCHIFFAAEAAAHQFVNDMDPGKLPAQHSGAFALRIIRSLVGRIDQSLFLLPVYDSDGAFRLQERMLCKWSAVFLCHHIFGVLNGLLRVAPHQVLVSQHVACLMNQRRIRF